MLYHLFTLLSFQFVDEIIYTFFFMIFFSRDKKKHVWNRVAHKKLTFFVFHLSFGEAETEIQEMDGIFS